MIGLVRKIVAGPKNRTHWKGIDLDLTYITQRVIAMAYPASGFEKTYRNSIDDVSQYFQQKHNQKCLVINVSMRVYDYQKFKNNVKDYMWPDHQAPCLSTLFIICDNMFNFLLNTSNGVVAVHCNHGKGRTGTCIITFMLFTRQFRTADEALTFYNKRRFIVNTYGVDQPCQRRYLDYVEKVLTMQKIPIKIKAFRLVKILQGGLNVKEHYIQISQTRTSQTKHTNLKVNQILKNNTIPLVGDIFIQLYQLGWTGENQAARINYNLNFIQKSKNGFYLAQFSGEHIKVNGKHKKDFSLVLYFQQYCKCHEQFKHNCQCSTEREKEEIQWQRMIQIVERSKFIKEEQMNLIVYGSKQKPKESLDDFLIIDAE